MDVVFFTASMGKGGSEKVLSLLAPEMASNGHRVLIYSLIESDISYKISSKIKVFFLRKYKSKNSNLLFWIKSIRRISKDSDVVISFSYRINLIVFIALLGMKEKRIIFCERTHPKHDGRSKLALLLANFVYKRVDKLVIQNRSIQNCFDKDVIKNSIIIPNPVDKKYNFNYQSDSKQLIAVGRLVKEKNFSLLIDAFSDVVKAIPELNLVIYGEGPQRSKLQSKINHLGLTQNIRLPGIVDDIFKELSKSLLT
jgi:glycosyltransferase involved in cell wall biosynthesis